MSISDPITRALGDTSGAAGVEFALMAPALIVLLIGAVDVGDLAYQKAQVSAAANAGALYAIHNGGGSTSNIATAASSATPITLSATPTVSTLYYCVGGDGTLTAAASAGASCGAGKPVAGTYIQVTTQATYKPLVSWGNWSSPTTLSAQTIVRTQ
jgi:Flp pilus assembly protein TadG